MARNNSAGRLALLLGAVFAAATIGLADTVIKTDGTRLTGRIVEANDRWVILEITRTGAKVTLPIARSAVRSIERGPEVPGPATTQPTTAKVQAGPGYYPLPIKGEIGVEIKSRSPFSDTFFVGYTNGSIGYVPVPEAYPEGGYEVEFASQVNPRAAGMITEGCLALLKRLKE